MCFRVDNRAVYIRHGSLKPCFILVQIIFIGNVSRQNSGLPSTVFIRSLHINDGIRSLIGKTPEEVRPKRAHFFDPQAALARQRDFPTVEGARYYRCDTALPIFFLNDFRRQEKYGFLVNCAGCFLSRRGILAIFRSKKIRERFHSLFLYRHHDICEIRARRLVVGHRKRDRCSRCVPAKSNRWCLHKSHAIEK